PRAPARVRQLALGRLLAPARGNHCLQARRLPPRPDRARAAALPAAPVRPGATPADGTAPRRARLAPSPRTALLGLVLLAATGIAFAPRLALDRHGPLPGPGVAVDARLPGLDPETVERTLTLPLERAVAHIPGLEEIEAYSFFGEARLLLGFAGAGARARALPVVRERVAEVARAAGSLGAPVVDVREPGT